jgi:hypothetical protein
MNERTPEQPTVSTRDLCIFGLTVGIAFGTMFGVVLPLLRRSGLRAWPWAVAAVLVAAALGAPESLRRFHKVWMRLGHVLGAIQSRVLLAIVFFLVVTPLGLLRRLARKAHGFDPQAATYRVPSVARPPRSMERPF